LIIIFPGKDSRVHKIAEIFQLPIVNKEYKEEFYVIEGELTDNDERFTALDV
jgi:hypothetical protein